MCQQCERGDHHLCWGHVGPMTTHPDSLPLCACSERRHEPDTTTRKDHRP